MADSKTKGKADLLTCSIHGLEAKAKRTGDDFLVLAGSQAVESVRRSAHQYHWAVDMRQRLIDEGALVKRQGCLVFTRDVQFSSPSAAAAVIQGGPANGRISWKNELGVSLKDLIGRMD